MSDDANETSLPENTQTEVPDAQEAQPDLEQEEAESPEGQPVEDEFEEIEWEGKTYKVPKPLKEGVLRQKDYTQKTQELAEQRRQHEAQQEAFKAHAQHFETYKKEYAQLAAIDDQLARYQSVDWTKFSQDDPANAQAAFFRYDQLRNARASVAETIAQKEHAKAFETQQETAKRIKQAKAVLSRDIPGWGPELQMKLRDFASKSYGYADDALDAIDDPRSVKVLHDAYVGRQLIAKQRAAEKEVKPSAEPVTPVGGRSASATKNPERMSTEEWMRWRNKQARQRAS